MKKIIISVLAIAVMFVVLVGFFYQNWRVSQGISNTDTSAIPTENSSAGTDKTVSTFRAPKRFTVDIGDLPEFPEGISPLVIPDLMVGDTIDLRWVSTPTTRYYGNSAKICLYVFDAKDEMVRDRHDADNCGYAVYQTSTYFPMSALLATTTASGGQYILTVDKKWGHLFSTKPASYGLGIIVVDELPAEGRSEWAGLISAVFSRPFKIIDYSFPKTK